MGDCAGYAPSPPPQHEAVEDMGYVLKLFTILNRGKGQP